MSSTLRIAAVAAVLFVSGCGSSGGGDQPASKATPEATAEQTAAVAREEGRVRATTRSFFAALVNRRGARACAMLEESNKRAIPQLAASRGLPSGLSCGEAVNRLAKKRKLGAVKLGEVTVDGNRASVEVSEAGGGGAAVELVKEGQEWKLLRF